MRQKSFGKKSANFFFMLFFAMVIAAGFLSGKVFSENFLKANVAQDGLTNSWQGRPSAPETITGQSPQFLADLQPQITSSLFPSGAQQSKTVPATGTSSSHNDKFLQVTKPLQGFACDYTPVKKPVFSGKFVSLSKSLNIDPGSTSEMVVFIKNTGNTPWFSSDSGCSNVPVVYLGTEHTRDRTSQFYLDGSQGSQWVGSNRIKMLSQRVEPGEVASFKFLIKAPYEPGVYREFYAPVVEGKAWIVGEALVTADIRVGGATYVDSPYVSMIDQSTNLSTLDLNAERKIEVSLKKQIMTLKIGEFILRTFPVSSGAYKTPTPPGNFKILSKQEVRVAGKKPHYIMPLFMMFKNGGYGIHALPSLRNDRGVFWREALNHIGSPRSHGCIRLLPDDAEFVWDFADVGTSMVVMR